MSEDREKMYTQLSEERDDEAPKIHDIDRLEVEVSHTFQKSNDQQDHQPECWYTPFDPDEDVSLLSPVPPGKFTAGLKVWHPDRPKQLGTVTGFYTSLLEVLYPGGDEVLHHWSHLDVLSVGCYVEGRTTSGRELAGWVKAIQFTYGKVALLTLDSAGGDLDKDARCMPLVSLDTVRICSPPWEWCTPPVWNKMPWVGLIVKIATVSEDLEDGDLVGNDLVVTGSRFAEGKIYIEVELDTNLKSRCAASSRVWVQYEHVVEARTGLRLLVFQPLRWCWRVNFGPSDEYILNELERYALQSV